MKLFQNKLSTNLCLLVISVVPAVAFPSIAGATTSAHAASAKEVINHAPSLRFSSNLDEKIQALYPTTEVGMKARFVRSEGWVQQQYVPDSQRSLISAVPTDESPSVVETFKSLQG
jgi:hypothetical protein